MANEDNQASKNLVNFLRTSLKFFGKEIGLISNQHFSIDQIINPNKDQPGEYRYVAQYGFPQSGCVSINFCYSQENNSVTIEKFSVYAPPIGKDIVMANFAPQTQVGPINISVNWGMDMGTQEHSSIQEIERNPNAIKILDIANSDLNQAQVLGDCKMAVPEGSGIIPCCNSTSISNEKGQSL